MLWVFAALACSSSGSPENGSLGDDTATDVGDDTATGVEETCGNGIDDNGNGTADGCDWSGEIPLDGTVLSTRATGSGLGFSLAVCDANGDGIDDVVTGAFGHDDMTGAVYVFYGPIRTDRKVDRADYALNESPKEEGQPRIGWSVDCRRDFDGDGLPDIVAGATGQLIEHPNRAAGAVYVVPGGGKGQVPIADAASSTWIGSEADDGLGYQVVAIDTDGDETDELAVTPNVADDGPRPFGIAYLFEDAGPGEFDADAAAAAYVYGDDGDRLRSTAGNAGDLDGDGAEELAIAGTNEVSEELLVFIAPLVGAIAKSDADVRIVGGPYGAAGWSGIGHADLDGDGGDDLFVGDTTYNSYDGAVFAFLSPIAGDANTDAAEFRFLGPRDDKHFGTGSDVTSPGDVDGDGIPDLFIGATYYSTVYLQYGGEPGEYLLEEDAQAWWESKSWWLPADAVAAGDVTGDGVVELLIGAWSDGDNNQGSVTILTSFDL